MAAEIKYNGNVIASPGAGQKATLKCEGMKMESDVVVEVDEATPALAPLTVTENGTYYPTYEAETVTWDENTEYDGTIYVDGIPLRYKKVANLTVPNDVSELENPMYSITVPWANGTTNNRPLYDIGIGFENGIYVLNGYAFTVVWVKDATFVNVGYGASLEDNTVYVTDYPWLAHASEYAGASFTLTAPGQKIDGFSSVTVAVDSDPPVMQTLEVNITEPGIFEFTPEPGHDGIIKVVVGVDVPQLTAPNISIVGDILYIEATDENTESFALFVDGIEVATVVNGEV